MKKSYIAAGVLACMTLPLAINAQSKLDITSRHKLALQQKFAPKTHLLSAERPDERLALIVTIASGYEADDLSSVISDYEAITPRYVVAYATQSQLMELNDLDCVEAISLSQRRTTEADLMRAATNVDAAHAGEGLPHPFKGKGVLVSLYDSGIQPNHLNFLDEEGNSRVKILYAYNSQGGSYDVPIIKESVYDTPAKIAAFTTEDNSATHGTHVLGIAAGSYYDASEGVDYRGVAPEADIAVACGWTDDDVILKGLKRLIDYGKRQNQPMVINLSLGDIMGPHDGTDSFTAALDALAEKTPIMISSGNSGDLNLALVKQLDTEAGIDAVRTTIAPNAALLARNKQLKGQKYDAIASIEIYASDERPFDIRVGVVNKKTGELEYYLPVEPGTTATVSTGVTTADGPSNEYLNQYYTGSHISVSTGVASNNRYMASIDLTLLKKAPFNNDIMPAIVVYGADGQQRIDLHAQNEYVYFSGSDIEGWDDATIDGSNNNLTCGKNMIGVGAYTTRITAPYLFGEVGSVAPFSGSGTVVDGTTRPHVVTPGHATISSYSTYFHNSGSYSSSNFPDAHKVTKDGMTYYWCPMSGTSMAAPVMTGTVALWLEANPNLTPADIKKIAMETAQKPDEPSTRWGAGRLDALAALKKVLDLTSVTTVANDKANEVFVQNSNGVIRVLAAGQDLITVELYGISGRLLLTTQGRNGEATLDATSLPAGIYIIRTTSDKASDTRRIVIK